jgi:hypothetical protein
MPKVSCPEGEVYLRVAFVEGRPHHVYPFCGKAGTAVASIADALGRLASRLLQRGEPVEDIIAMMSGITHDRSTIHYDALSLSDAIARGLEMAMEDHDSSS